MNAPAVRFVISVALALSDQPASGAPAQRRMVSLDSEPTALSPSRRERESSNSDGLFGPIRFGPMVGSGLPNLVNLGILVKATEYFGFGANMGLIPTLRIDYYGDATLSFQEYDVFARIHPFGGGFFLGAGIGYATVTGSVTGQFDTTPYASQVPPNVALPRSLTYESKGFVKTLILAPQIGYYYVTALGFTFGGDVGAQVPVAPSTVVFESRLVLPPETPAQIVAAVRTQLLEPNDHTVRASLEKLGRTPIPAINVRIGWMF